MDETVALEKRCVHCHKPAVAFVFCRDRKGLYGSLRCRDHILREGVLEQYQGIAAVATTDFERAKAAIDMVGSTEDRRLIFDPRSILAIERMFPATNEGKA